MLSTVVLSNENQTCRGWEAPPLQVGEDVTTIEFLQSVAKVTESCYNQM